MQFKINQRVRWRADGDVGKIVEITHWSVTIQWRDGLRSTQGIGVLEAKIKDGYCVLYNFKDYADKF